MALVQPAYAEKVDLDPSNWGHEDGGQCVKCHKKSSHGLFEQWKGGAHGKANVNCYDCHRAEESDADAFEHKGNIISLIVSPKDCARCHPKEFKQQQGSTHADAVVRLDKYVKTLGNLVSGPAVVNAGCAQCHGSRVKVRGDGSLEPESWPNTGIGRINPDGSRGSCSSCHVRHSFSKAQARDPQACSRCHSGLDSPDKEIYDASKHGMVYSSRQHEMNFESDSWVTGVDNNVAPTCVTCHMAATPSLRGTHDVGMRNAWKLNTPVSEKQYLIIFEDGDKQNWPVSKEPPKKGDGLAKRDGTTGIVKVVAGPKRRRAAMMKVCVECHGTPFANGFMKLFDDVVVLYNEKFGKPALAIMQELYKRGKLTPTPFDEPIEYTYWELWHDEGARARHGASMGSPNHVWWEGMYQVARNFYTKFLPEVHQVAGFQLGSDLVATHVGQSKHHEWMNHHNIDDPILHMQMDEYIQETGEAKGGAQ
ncbi:MAG: hypothetical protein HQL52_10140 [Magnetococcales bacterium]|nr:hypothetical protein [Magnetococcales bacterium]